ncbi:hypothetical protein BN2877_32960 [Achromobacter xylosoxidans]|nr:hypothetical protein BN2877_32960 [Achromobacter xylosoxidans]
MRAFMLTFLCVGAITLLSAAVFRRLDDAAQKGSGDRAAAG